MLRKLRDWETFSFSFFSILGFFLYSYIFFYVVFFSVHFQGRKKKIKKNHPHFDAAKLRFEYSMF